MWGKKRCCSKKSFFPWGYILISTGAGLILAYLIPYYFLITMLGISLIIAGICCFKKR